MGFLVMVYVPDDESAADVMGQVPDTGRVVGMYQLPAARETPTCPGTCRIAREARKGNHTNGWGREPVMGYLVHECGRRHRDWRKRIATVFLDTFGINLLPRDRTPALFQNPEGWGR